MKLQSILAIYILFWTLSLFLVLPFGARSPYEDGVEVAPGHAPSAPHAFDFRKAALRATIVSAVAMALFYGNYRYGWVTIDMLDWSGTPGR